MNINVVIADNQQMFVDGIQYILNNQKSPKIKLLGFAHNMEELSTMITSKVDVLILDIALEGDINPKLIATVKSQSERLKILILTQYDDIKIVRECFIRGADGFITKSHLSLELIQAIQSIMVNETYIADGINITPKYEKANSINENNHKDRLLLKMQLSNREREILKKIVEFKNNRTIAKELFISDQTVSAHRKRILKKMGLSSSVDLIKFTMDNRLV